LNLNQLPFIIIHLVLLNINIDIGTWVDMEKYLKFVKEYSNNLTTRHNIKIF
jgi:hypothetical protein